MDFVCCGVVSGYLVFGFLVVFDICWWLLLRFVWLVLLVFLFVLFCLLSVVSSWLFMLLLVSWLVDVFRICWMVFFLCCVLLELEELCVWFCGLLVFLLVFVFVLVVVLLGCCVFDLLLGDLVEGCDLLFGDDLFWLGWFLFVLGVLGCFDLLVLLELFWLDVDVDWFLFFCLVCVVFGCGDFGGIVCWSSVMIFFVRVNVCEVLFMWFIL